MNEDKNELEVDLFENLTQEEMDFIAGAGDVEGEVTPVISASVASLVFSFSASYLSKYSVSF